ncbi:hypothetical protein [Vibrio mediterranei]|nr:hypothetical protein [Vibrio mediterranei]
MPGNFGVTVGLCVYVVNLSSMVRYSPLKQALVALSIAGNKWK